MRKLLSLTAAIAFLASSASAQTSRPVELGIDAGASVGIGDGGTTVINIPAQAFRVGFFRSDRLSIEPRFGINIASGGGDTFTSYALEVGALYHFARSSATGRDLAMNSFFVRPFAGLVGATGGGNSDTDTVVGGGIGMKAPLMGRLASRFEANFGHRFGDGGSNQIGLLAGISFFTR